MYIMVPRVNLTKGRWRETLDLFRNIPESQVPEYEPKDPDSPIFDNEKDADEVIIHGHTWYFNASYVKDDSWPEEQWPVPKGMGLICASALWDKSGPSDESEDEYILVGGAVMEGMKGDFVNYANELNIYDVETYRGFQDMNYGTILLSRRVVKDVGLEVLEKLGTVTEIEGSYRFDGVFQMGIDEKVYDLLDSVSYLRPINQMSPPPILDEDAIGVSLTYSINPNEKIRHEKEMEREKAIVRGRAAFDREFEEEYGPVPSPEDLEKWAIEQADRAIAGDMKAYKALKEMRLTFSSRNIRLEKSIVHRQMVRYGWKVHGGVNYYTIEETENLARDLMELDQYGEAAWLFKKIWVSHPEDHKPYRTDTLRRLAVTFYKSGKLDEAEEAMREYITIENPNDNFMDVTTANFLFDLADIHLRRGEVDEASQVMERSKPYARFLEKGFQYILCKYMGMRARVEMAKLNLPKAEDLASRSVNYAWSAFFVSAEDVANNYRVLAQVLYEKGDRAGADAARRAADDLMRLGNKEDYLKEKGITPDDVLELRRK